jgi:hypothetical protein
LRKNLRLLFECGERLQFFDDQIGVQLFALPLNDVLDVHPILAACGKGFVDDKVLGATRAQITTISHVPKRAALDGTSFKGKTAQSYIEWNAVWVSKQEHARSKGEGRRVWHSLRKSFQEHIDELRLRTEVREEGDVDVVGIARFTPALKGKAANETEGPAISNAQFLEFQGGAKERDHDFRANPNNRCCSTKPELRGAGDQSCGLGAALKSLSDITRLSSSVIVLNRSTRICSRSGPVTRHCSTHRRLASASSRSIHLDYRKMRQPEQAARCLHSSYFGAGLDSD